MWWDSPGIPSVSNKGIPVNPTTEETACVKISVS